MPDSPQSSGAKDRTSRLAGGYRWALRWRAELPL